MTDIPPPARRLAPEHRRRVIVVIVVTQLVLALVTATTVYAVWRHLDGNIQAGPDIPPMSGAGSASAASGPQGPLNVLVLGTDTRSGGGDAIDGEAGCGCSDTTILFHVSADRSSAYAISIPRDALVKPVDCTKDHLYYGPGGVATGLVEWNQAYSVGKAPCTAQQIQDDFGVKVNDYVVLDFDGFQKMVDKLGGVNVCVPFELYDPRYDHLDLPAGPSVHLDGSNALKYVRLRHGYYPGTLTPRLDGTDPGRIKRQQVFIAALLDKLFSTSTLTRPDRLVGFANALTDSITTNSQIAHVDKLIDLAEQFKSIDLHHIRFVTLPSQNYGAGPEVNRVQVLPAAYQLMKRVAKDESLGRFAKGSLSAGKHHKPEPGNSNEQYGIC